MYKKNIQISTGFNIISLNGVLLIVNIGIFIRDHNEKLTIKFNRIHEIA